MGCNGNCNGKEESAKAALDTPAMISGLAANTTAGRIISDTMRRAIQNGLAELRPLTSEQTGKLKVAEPQAVYGFKALTSSGQHIVTPDMVRSLRDELGE